jgi:hypothetical protein
MATKQEQIVAAAASILATAAGVNGWFTSLSNGTQNGNFFAGKGTVVRIRAFRRIAL